MSIKYEEANILIVSDSAAEITDLKNLLATLVGRLTFALNKDEGIQAFKAQHPIMLVLAFTEVANSVQFYQQLNQEIPEITEHFHHTLLLCSSKEAYDAYHLCEEGVFDDYLVDHPLYDPQRIILSIEQALQNQLMERKVLALHQQIRHSEKLARLFDISIKHQVDKGIKQLHELTRWLEQHTTDADTLHLKTVQKVNRIIKELEQTQQKIATHEFPSQIEQERILLVDDDDFYREQVAAILASVGYQVAEANNGITALKQLSIKKPDLMLLDYKMPGMDGLTLLKKIKGSAVFHDIPVIMLTGFSHTALVRESRKAGIAGYIIKPGNRDFLLSKINQVIQHRSSP